MTHYRDLYEESEYIGSHDFKKPAKMTIHSVERVKIIRKKKDDSEPDEFRPHIYLKDKDGNKYKRAYLFPKSVGELLKMRFGTNLEDWAGKEITLYATKCMSFGSVEECVRVEATKAEHDKIKKWMKKRGARVNGYLLD